ncbi:MAG TPA: Gfo/Idh/MocA family oxidoreductase [Pseudolysinimonas sp.]|nr:Gfo/Idh/MocA family oxidoreductase [Pseudolysinimonas sp.]
MQPPRVGVVGTGPWARNTHLPAAARSLHVDLVGVLGRTGTEQVASEFDIRGYQDLDAFLEDIDIAVMAVPPATQVSLAVRAAERGVHLLLEKPLAVDVAHARAVEAAVERSGVVGAVFFTHLFVPSRETWLADRAREGRWTGLTIQSFGGLLADGTDPYAASTWRRSSGGLWDLGPHAVAQACRLFGAVVAVTARRGSGDLMSARLTHRDGGSTDMMTALDRPGEIGGFALRGPDGVSVPPPIGDWGAVARDAAESALGMIVQRMRDRAPMAADVALGRHVVDVLAGVELAASSGSMVRLG